MTTTKLTATLSILSLLALAPGACAVRARGVPFSARVGIAPPPLVVLPAPVVVASAPPPRYAPPPPQAQPYPPPPGAPPPQGPLPTAACIDPAERDLPEHFHQATPLDANSSTVGCTYSGDGDLFVVTAPPASGGQVIRYTLQGQYEMAPTIKVFNANRRQIDAASSGRSQQLRGWVYVAGGTQFYVRVGQIHSVKEAYNLVLSASPLNDATEPNNAAEQAVPLRPGQPVTGFMADPLNDDAALPDWYRIEVRHDGDLAIEVDMSEGIASNIRLYDGNRRQVGARSGSRGERVMFEPKGLRRGTYHLVIQSIHSVPAAGSGEPPPAMTRPYTISLVR